MKTNGKNLKASASGPLLFHLFHVQMQSVICFALMAVNGFAAVRYVNLNNPNPVPPYTSWATAAVNIQDAIDASATGDEVLVTNGIYATGGRVAAGSALTNRILVDKPIVVRSVNGAQVTFIQGYQVPDSTYGDSAIRCAYLAPRATLSGFSLTNGATRNVAAFTDSYGGAVCCESSNSVVADCILSQLLASAHPPTRLNRALCALFNAARCLS